MSIDYCLVCYSCHMEIHLGQFMAGKWSFGFGTGDRQGDALAGEFIMEHASHMLRIVESDNVEFPSR